MLEQCFKTQFPIPSGPFVTSNCAVLSVWGYLKKLDMYSIHYLLETSSQNGGRFEAKGLASSLRFCVDDS